MHAWRSSRLTAVFFNGGAVEKMCILRFRITDPLDSVVCIWQSSVLVRMFLMGMIIAIIYLALMFDVDSTFRDES